MIHRDRIHKARQLVREADAQLVHIDDIPDPVAKRRALVGTARLLQEAANTLTQNGFLTE